MPRNRVIMKKFTILGLLLVFACNGEETEPRNSCHPMISVSDASPIQFWPVDCETWNQSRPPGVHHYCFCHPWQCDDQIKIPILSNELSDFDEIVSTFLSNLDGWFNTANGVTPGTGGSTADWAWSSDLGGSAKVTTVNTFGTKFLRLSNVSVPQQEFFVRIKFSVPSSRNSSNLKLSFIIRDSSNSQLLNEDFAITSTGAEETVDILVSNPTDWINADHFLITTGSTSYVAGDDIHISEIRYIYESPAQYKVRAFNEDDELIFTKGAIKNGDSYIASFIPSDYDICNEKITLKILESGANIIDIDEDLSTWINVNTGSGPAWTTGSAPTVVLPSSGTISDEISGSAISETGGDFSFDYDIDLIDGVGVTIDISIILYKEGVQVGVGTQGIVDASDGNKTGTLIVTASDAPDEIRVKMILDVGEVTVQLNAITPNESTPDVEVFKSDCIDIKTAQSESLLIDYTNHTNYAGIEYGTETPDPSFSIRIPAVFFETRFPQEGEDFQTSSNEVFSVNNQIKEQRLLSTERMPTYMHRKILEILNHQFLYIDGEYWVKGGENYEKKEKSNKRDSFDMYTCWLTRQNFVVRNIL